MEREKCLCPSYEISINTQNIKFAHTCHLVVHLSGEHRVTTHVTVGLSNHRTVCHALAGVLTLDANPQFRLLGRVQMNVMMRVLVETVRVPSVRVL